MWPPRWSDGRNEFEGHHVLDTRIVITVTKQIDRVESRLACSGINREHTVATVKLAHASQMVAFRGSHSNLSVRWKARGRTRTGAAIVRV